MQRHIEEDQWTLEIKRNVFVSKIDTEQEVLKE